MQALTIGQRLSKWFWIMVLAVIGFGLLSNFGPMALLVCGFIVLMAKIFISAARNNKGILLQDESGKLYRAFAVSDSNDDPFDETSPFYSYRDDPAHPFHTIMMNRHSYSER